MPNTHNIAKTQFIEANGISYAYRKFGSGNRLPLVCLQHFRGGLDNWDPAVADGLAQNRSVILFNNAGIASSGGEPADTIGGMAMHVIAFVEALGLRSFDLFGFSMGGFVAQQVTLDRPDLIRRLILAGTGPEGGESMVGYPDLTTRHATQEIPVEENFLYLFFYPTETGRAAGHAFWMRRNERADQDPILTDCDASAGKGNWRLGHRPNDRSLCETKGDQTAGPGGTGENRFNGPYVEFVHPPATTTERGTNCLSGLGSWIDIPVSK
jgi:pimeloyl-ACP methyl ester carboxylesterase